ncbi:MAG: membrane-anchored protein YejM (alkaline phosphatase superfamily) [Pseudohongiellaceae bacterium]|jgi:membrane-anchored protein YejM (alkaline phosphatase superfamily)
MSNLLFIQRNAVLVIVTTFLFSLYGAYSHAADLATIPFFITATLFQAALYCLPLYLLVKGEQYLPPLAVKIASSVHALTIVSLILSNYKLYSLYGFYINSFVINIMTTPGGIEALGANASTYKTLAMYALLGLSVYAVYLRFIKSEYIINLLPNARITGLLVFICFLIHGFSYAAANHKGDSDLLNTSKAIAWYIPITAKSFLRDLGIEGRDDDDLDGSSKGGKVNYPKFAQQPLTIKTPYNIVWLVAESWRFDMLSERIMPATYKFANNNIHFTNHYSGGNGTRMGMFTQFYGLYGTYWFDIMRERKSPLILDALIENNYQMKAFTSAKFTYPEFDKTIFSRFSSDQLHSDSKGHGWQRDKRNTTKLINYIEKTDEPFFTFMFFESPHANYYFPEENIIEPDYLENFDYLDTNISKHIKGIKNRYINSSNHLDTQIDRVLTSLKASGKLDNTIVMITGDHGEEFMEKGRWGHNSTFSEEQVRVPMILHIPGQAAQQHDMLTSHLDIPATLLHTLGITISPEQYSFGQNLLSESYQRDFAVASDWHGNALITPNIKYVMSSKARRLGNNVTTINDAPIEASDITAADQSMLTQFIKSVGSFYQ